MNTIEANQIIRGEVYNVGAPIQTGRNDFSGVAIVTLVEDPNGTEKEKGGKTYRVVSARSARGNFFSETPY